MASMCLHLEGFLGLVLSEAVRAPLKPPAFPVNTLLWGENSETWLASCSNNLWNSSSVPNSQELEDSALIDHSQCLRYWEWLPWSLQAIFMFREATNSTIRWWLSPFGQDYLLTTTCEFPRHSREQVNLGMSLASSIFVSDKLVNANLQSYKSSLFVAF